MNRYAQGTLVPRRLFFDPPEKQLVRISPDGRRIAFQAPINGVLNLWLAPVDDPENARPLTNYRERNIGPALVWAYDNRHILIIRDNAGDENWCIWSVDIETGEARALTPTDGVQAHVQQTSRHFPGEALIAHNERDKRYFDIYRIDVATGKASLVEKNDGFVGFFTDQHFQVRRADRYTADGGIEHLSRDESGAWSRVVSRIPVEDSLTTWPIEYSHDGEVLYWKDSRGRDKAAAVAEDIKTGAIRILAEDARADIGGMLFDPVTMRPIAAASTFDRSQWKVLDPEFQQDFDILAQLFRGELVFTDISDDGLKIIIAHRQDTRPLEYFCYDRSTKQAGRLFSAQSRLENVPLVPMEPVIVRARDGLELLCYLSRPTESKTGPGPMVLLVHGGPWARDLWGLNPVHQWLANRGYGVLSVNFRGSTGFGKVFVNAANREWGGKMQDDLIDAVDWAISEGIADPNRVAIMGGSYGGYAALAGLTFTPEKFACAVDLVGISNLVTFINAIPDYWRSWQSEWKVRMGDFTTEEGRRFLEERSPLNHIDRIVRPLLIAQGANDVRVKVSESDQIAAAMQERGIPVTYILYPDEGHGVERAENRRSYFAVVEAFLAAHLGGQREPVGEDFTGSSVQFMAGRELIDGLSETKA
ncbi:alpha/beta hydrolase family protein [Phyllobacterium leguminum]|uniref:Dipeptidyl aminopeptidase/acylaminoacyl peptidase n=1 Tax=Phyllobacterium leguminum TaxID=314237 RepID=A0A318T7D4_9HYPH|nr:S9 family peptidase [Phyllobacterium leguminum]PYE86414.1 dipeptidyl aminopeptidase/acylaminoacyl peptidase [Phyllobacterium leguminum]